MEEEYLYFDEHSVVVHELEPAYGGQTGHESLVNKINYRNTNWVGLHSSTLNTFKV